MAVPRQRSCNAWKPMSSSPPLWGSHSTHSETWGTKHVQQPYSLIWVLGSSGGVLSVTGYSPAGTEGSRELAVTLLPKVFPVCFTLVRQRALSICGKKRQECCVVMQLSGLWGGLTGSLCWCRRRWQS